MERGRLIVGGAGAVVVAGGVAAWGQTPSFTEVSDSIGISVTQEFADGTPYDFMVAGGACGDFNNDGWSDLFVLGCGTSPDHLYINNGDGTFVDRAAQWGVARLERGLGVSAGDYNGDGWLDLYITSMGPAEADALPDALILYRNNGDGTFTDVAVQAGVNSVGTPGPEGIGSAWGDYDLDGDLDLAVSSYVRRFQGTRLFRNNGDGTFTDATVESRVQEHMLNTSGFLPGFMDMNRDGWPDLLMICDNGTSRYLTNNGDGTFSNDTGLVDALGTANAMGSSVGDVNGDGLLDWYVSSSYWDALHGPGNLLLVQNPDHSFSNAAQSAGVDDGGWAWGTIVVDVNNDGLNDLACTNGWGSEWGAEPSYLYMNNGDMTFTEMGADVGFIHTDQGRGLINFDYDNDGDQDLVIFATGQPVRVFRNDLAGPDTHWLRVNLDTSRRGTLAPMGYQSYIELSIDGVAHTGCIDGGFSHCSQGEIGAHFGLGSSTSVDALRVRWNDGTYTTLTGVAADQILTVVAPFHPADFNGDDAVDLRDLGDFAAAFNAADLSADLDGSGALSVGDFFTFVRLFSLP